MKGGIYSEQKCSLCGKNFVYIEKKSGLFCSKHPSQVASGRFIVKFGRQIKKRFSSFHKAERFLTGIRYEVDRNTFDPRDYKANAPLGFRNLAEQWLEIKKKEVKPRSYENLKRYIYAAINEWDNLNIKEISYAHFEDFLLNQPVSNKTKSNMKSCLHSFWVWLRKRKIITLQQFPEFPAIKYQLGTRKIVSKESQEAIIEEVKKLTYQINPKIWLGIKWLATYISIRPVELLKMDEKDIDPSTGYFFIRHAKEGKEKTVPMCSEDREILEAMPTGLPDLRFFSSCFGNIWM